MKNLLVVAYYFPPSGGPGVQRVLKHIKYLPEFGWNPIVLTVSNGQFPARDESLLKQIPENIEVLRTHIFEPYDIYRLLTGKKPGTAIDVNVIKKDDQKISFKEKFAEFIRATIFIPDARIGWIFTARKAVREIIKEKNIDAVYSSSPPYTCSLIARYAKKYGNIPWIAGFRDPWTGFISSPKRWIIPSIIDKHLEYSVFSESDAVECAWEGIIKDALDKYPNLNRSKFHHVPNGFDSSDFPKVEEKSNNKFTVTYTGSMYGRRNPKALFEALELLISNKKIDPNNFKLKFIGRFGAEVEEMFHQVSFKESIEIINYIPHEESLRELMLSDASLLVVDESKESAEIVPGKVYEYIGILKPVIAIGPRDGAIAKLLEATQSGKIAHQSEIDSIAENFLFYYNSWENKINNNDSNFKLDYNPDLEKINSFERKEAARKLTNLLDTLI